MTYLSVTLARARIYIACTRTQHAHAWSTRASTHPNQAHTHLMHTPTSRTHPPHAHTHLTHTLTSRTHTHAPAHAHAPLVDQWSIVPSNSSADYGPGRVVFGGIPVVMIDDEEELPPLVQAQVPRTEMQVDLYFNNEFQNRNVTHSHICVWFKHKPTIEMPIIGSLLKGYIKWKSKATGEHSLETLKNGHVFLRCSCDDTPLVPNISFIGQSTFHAHQFMTFFTINISTQVYWTIKYNICRKTLHVHGAERMAEGKTILFLSSKSGGVTCSWFHPSFAVIP